MRNTVRKGKKEIKQKMNNEDTLKQKLLDMAKVFHEFCMKHGLQYFMIGGTMLGAVRHKGFIPWDDDMDFGMLRKDYDRMMQLRTELPQGYSFNDYKTVKGYKYGFCKMYDENTTYIESAQDTKLIGGVYIDIFPLDNIGNDLETAEKRMTTIRRRKWIINGIYQKGKRTTFLKTAGTKVLQRLPETPRWFDWPYRAVEKYKNVQTEYITNVYGVANEREVIPLSYVGTPKLYDFEDTQFYGVEKYDEYLTRIYGDYMTPPPEDKRGGHSICYVDYNKPYKEYIRENQRKKKE